MQAAATAKLGNRWNASWEATGFTDQSTGIMRTQDQRFSLLGDLKTYFTAMPANQSVNMGTAAALCLAAWTALSDARQAVANAELARATHRRKASCSR